MKEEALLKEIEAKYEKYGENPATYLNGLLHAKPLNYWDYVQVETLLSLQNPRTEYKDEPIFIMYSQITELILKSILHELKQITGENTPSEEMLLVKLNRLNNYVRMLLSFFNMMKEGLSYEEYSLFRKTLTPASGFQCVQFRYVELYCTRLENLASKDSLKQGQPSPSVENSFENIYWKEAGVNRKTGKKTLTLLQFEEKYLDTLLRLAKEIEGKTLEDKILQLPVLSPQLKNKLAEFDHLYNIEWPLVHLETAKHFLDRNGENKAATGSSEWKKYLHPDTQKRRFFPSLVTKEVLEDKK